MKDLWSGKYGCGSVFVVIGTAISVVLWFGGTTAATSYVLPVTITLIGELIKFSAFRQINDQLSNRADYLHFLNDRNVFLTEENRHFKDEIEMLYAQINRLEAVIESNERETRMFEEEFDSMETPTEPRPKRWLH